MMKDGLLGMARYGRQPIDIPGHSSVSFAVVAKSARTSWRRRSSASRAPLTTIRRLVGVRYGGMLR